MPTRIFAPLPHFFLPYHDTEAPPSLDGVELMATPLTVVIFGASGDLTSRKLIPALFNLAQKGRLPAEVMVLGVSRTQFTDEAFREHLAGKAQETLADESFDAAKWAEFAKRVHYVS